MAHELIPLSGSLPTPSEVARLLMTEFAHVKVDPSDGFRQAQKQADWIERAQARVFLGHQQEALAFAAKLRNLSMGEALTIELGDDPNTTKLTVVVLPGGSIKFGFASEEDEAISTELVERCARVLDCETIEI